MDVSPDCRISQRRAFPLHTCEQSHESTLRLLSLRLPGFCRISSPGSPHGVSQAPDKLDTVRFLFYRGEQRSPRTRFFAFCLGASLRAAGKTSLSREEDGNQSGSEPTGRKGESSLVSGNLNCTEGRLLLLTLESSLLGAALKKEKVILVKSQEDKGLEEREEEDIVAFQKPALRQHHSQSA